MQTWMNFWNFLFWLTIFGFLINLENFFKILMYSELTWLVLYCYTITCGAVNDDIILISNSLFILGFAGLEFSIGILLLIIFKNIIKTINLNDGDSDFKKISLFEKKKINAQKAVWNI